MKTLKTVFARCKMGLQSRVNGNAHCQENPANEAVVLGAGRPHAELMRTSCSQKVVEPSARLRQSRLSTASPFFAGVEREEYVSERQITLDGKLFAASGRR
jgi:hypothetical protein